VIATLELLSCDNQESWWRFNAGQSKEPRLRMNNVRSSL
jgi:hypothetical protein